MTPMTKFEICCFPMTRAQQAYMTEQWTTKSQYQADEYASQPTNQPTKKLRAESWAGR
jgi:hypothetical protein